MPKTKSTSILQCGREINQQELDLIQETVELFPKLSRTELAATVSEHLEWKTASGSCKIDACMKLLEKLEHGGLITLPELHEKSSWKKIPRSIPLTSRTKPQDDIFGKLRDIGPVRVEVVTGKREVGLWNEYTARHHGLGYKKPFGCFLKYFIVSETGYMGCLLFAGASKALTSRDRWIGWTDNQRLRNLGWVVNNSRFLIFPWVHIKNLASHVLGAVCRRIADDWERQWGYQPVLLETFVDPLDYEGTSYKAANWEYLGMTTGEGLVRPGKTYNTTPKKIFVKPLVENFRAILCSEELKGREDE